MIALLRVDPADSAKLSYKPTEPKLDESLALLRKFIEFVFDPKHERGNLSMSLVNKTAKLLQVYGYQTHIQSLLTDCMKVFISKHLIFGKNTVEAADQPNSGTEKLEHLTTAKIVNTLAEFYANLTKKILPTITSVLGFTASAIDSLMTNLLTSVLTATSVGSSFEIMNCFRYLKTSQAVDHSCKVNSQTMNEEQVLSEGPGSHIGKKTPMVAEPHSVSLPTRAQTLDWICGALIAAVDTDRLGMKIVDLEDISTVCRLLRRTNCFDGEFKKTFLEQSGEFYRELLQKQLPIHNLHDYTSWLEDKLQDERTRCDTLFDDSLSQSMYYVMKKILVDDIISTILNANFQTLLLEGHKKELVFYYEQMKSSETFDNFLTYFEGVVRTKVEACLSTREEATEAVYKFYSTMANLVKSVYKEESKVQSVLDRSLETIISKSDTTFARQLANWLAHRLETENNERRIDDGVQQAVTLLRFLQNKKYFMSIYNQR